MKGFVPLAGGITLLASVSALAADPLGLVDYDALRAARAEQTFCTGGVLCTVILPDGRAVQQNADGAWLAAGQDQTVGNFALGYALTLAIFDRCDQFLDGIEPAVFEAAVAEMQAVYRLSLGIVAVGQATPEITNVEAAFQLLRADLAGYVDSDPDLARCIVPGQLATLLVEMAQEDYWRPELTRLREAPTLPTATFAVE